MLERKSFFYREHYVENATGASDNWKTKINGKVICGQVAFIRESIDWWRDLNRDELPPHRLAAYQADNAKQKKRTVEEYRGFKLINDTGNDTQWYMLHKNRLLKGSKEAIKAKIDLALKNLSNRRLNS